MDGGAAPGGWAAPPPAGGGIGGIYPPLDIAPPPGQAGYTPPPGQAGYAPPPGQAGYAPPLGQAGHPPPGVAGYVGPPPGTVMAQPGGGGPGYVGPPGLEYLSQLGQILVKQKVEVLEAITGFEQANKYKVFNTVGQHMYDAKEDTDCCTRQCCGPGRPFDMTIKDLQGTEVIHLYRPLRCQSCLFPCCLQELEVSSPPGSVIGRVEQDWSLCHPKFTIKDQQDQAVLRLEGPFCTCKCFGDVKFKVFTVQTGEEVGVIAKQWTGLFKEALTDADNFNISFPVDLDVRVKATLLGALFLIDFMYFEQGNENNDS